MSSEEPKENLLAKPSVFFSALYGLSFCYKIREFYSIDDVLDKPFAWITFLLSIIMLILFNIEILRGIKLKWKFLDNDFIQLIISVSLIMFIIESLAVPVCYLLTFLSYLL